MNKKASTITSTISVLAMLAMPISATAVITPAATVSATAVPTTPAGQITSTQVTTDAELNAYTGAALNSDTSADKGVSANDDAEINDVSYQDNGVTAEFTQPGKFLGLFPTSIDAQVIVTADGTTTVTYPWYAFLIRKHATAINTIFQTQVNEATAGKADLDASASASLSPQAKAVILDAIRQAIHGLRSKAAVSASSTTSASAQ